MGSEDGWAIFNWRMVFPMKIPCAFPRVTLKVYDAATFSSDEALGEVQLKFDNIIKKLLNEGKYEQSGVEVGLRNIKKGNIHAVNII